MQEEKNYPFSRPVEAVAEFHNAFGLPVRNIPTVDISEKEFTLRFNLMKEENEEYFEAVKNGDLIEVADALGDMLYILAGTLNAHGMQHKIVEVFEEIHRSNMSKLDENGKPIYREDGKVLKSNRYFKPDIKSIMER